MNNVKWAKTIKSRDKNRCVVCGTDNNLNAHHLLPKHTYSDLSLDLKNGITLCRRCHRIAHGGTYDPRYAGFNYKFGTEQENIAVNEIVNTLINQNYDCIDIDVSKTAKGLIQSAAAAKGETINGYIKTAIKAKIKADTGKDIDL